MTTSRRGQDDDITARAQKAMQDEAAELAAQAEMAATKAKARKLSEARAAQVPSPCEETSPGSKPRHVPRLPPCPSYDDLLDTSQVGRAEGRVFTPGTRRALFEVRTCPATSPSAECCPGDEPTTRDPVAGACRCALAACTGRKAARDRRDSAEKAAQQQIGD